MELSTYYLIPNKKKITRPGTGYMSLPKTHPVFVFFVSDNYLCMYLGPWVMCVMRSFAPAENLPSWYLVDATHKHMNSILIFVDSYQLSVHFKNAWSIGSLDAW